MENENANLVQNVTEEISREELIKQVRSHASSLLRAGVQPSDITFVFAFVATDLGIFINKDPADVYSVVTSALVSASLLHRDAHVKAHVQEGKDETTAMERPLSERLH